MPESNGDTRAALLALARQLVGADDRTRLTIIVAPADAAVVITSPLPPPLVPSQLRGLRKLIWDALGRGPLASRTIARQIHRTWNSHFRKVLASMRRDGLVKRVAQRYVRAPVLP